MKCPHLVDFKYHYLKITFDMSNPDKLLNESIVKNNQNYIEDY